MSDGVDAAERSWTTSTPSISVTLTHLPLSTTSVIDFVRSPSAGATVLFIGTTRDTFDSKSVSHLSYTAYVPLALKTMQNITETLRQKHGLTKISMVHRLGVCEIGQESIVIAVSAPHRGAAWRGGEEALELCKERVEVWKREEFVGEEGVWRANRDGAKGFKEEQPGE